MCENSKCVAHYKQLRKVCDIFLFLNSKKKIPGSKSLKFQKAKQQRKNEQKRAKRKTKIINNDRQSNFINEKPPVITFIPGPMSDISSTQIREKENG